MGYPRACFDGARGATLPALLLALTVCVFASPKAYGEELIERGTDWRYQDDGSNHGEAWRNADCDDSA